MKYIHTCYRVFDLYRSLDFFTNKLGLEATDTLSEGPEGFYKSSR